MRRPSAFSLSTLSLIVVILGSVAVNYGYANPESAKKILADEGYTDVSISGRTMWGCDREFYRTGFIGKNSRGITVMGVVCESYFSGAAVIKRK